MVDTILQINIPELVNTTTSGGVVLLNPIAGDCTDDQVTVTGIAVNPVSDLGDFGLCGTIGEVVYVSTHDSEGCATNAAGQPFRTRIFAFGFTDAAGGVTPCRSDPDRAKLAIEHRRSGGGCGQQSVLPVDRPDRVERRSDIQGNRDAANGGRMPGESANQPSNSERTEWTYWRDRAGECTGYVCGSDIDSRRAEADELLGTVNDVWEYSGDLEWAVQHVVRGAVAVGGSNGRCGDESDRGIVRESIGAWGDAVDDNQLCGLRGRI